MFRSPCRRNAIAVLALSCLALASQHISASDTQVLRPNKSGLVIDAISGKPVSGAAVTLVGLTGRRALTTNSRGEFPIDPASSVAYATAEHPGYIRAKYGDRFPGDGTVTSLAGVGDVTIRLWPASAITGQIRGTQNPARVYALRRSFVGGHLRYEQVRTAAVDSQGTYHLGGLVPDEYLVVAVPSGAETLRAIPTFYPSASMPSEAFAVTPEAGEVVYGIDISMRTQCEELSAQVEPDSGPVPTRITVTPLWTPRVSGPALDRHVRGNAQHRFALPCVSPGTHLLHSRVAPPDSVVETPLPHGVIAKSEGPFRETSPRSEAWSFVHQSITIGDRDKALPFTLRPTVGHRVMGRIDVVDGEPPVPPITLHHIRVIPMSADGLIDEAMPRVSIADDGTFVSTGLPDGKYTLNVSGPLNLISIDGPDGIATDAPFEINGADVNDVIIRVSDRSTEVYGRVASQSANFSSVAVYVFPRDRERWIDFGSVPASLREVRVFSDGTFRFEIPPGEYWIAAPSKSPGPWWKRPSQLAELVAGGTVLSVKPGDRLQTTVNVK